MALSQTSAAAEKASEVVRLRAQITRMQRRTADVRALPVHAALAPLFPEGGLRPGAAYSLAGSASLLHALLGEASRSGAWCAVIGMPQVSIEAAEAHGVDSGRLALIPRPGVRWLQAAATAAEVFPLVAVRPPREPSPAEAARLDARLREHGSALLVTGSWPGAEAVLTVRAPEWLGIAGGHGSITSRAVTVSAAGRRVPHPRTVRVLLPGPSGSIEAVASPAAARGHLRAVVA